MKRQIVLGFTGVLIVGVILVLGACNKHSYKTTEFETGIEKLYSKHHGGGDDSSEVYATEKGEHHGSKVETKHQEKGLGSEKKHDKAPSHPAKTLFPKK